MNKTVNVRLIDTAGQVTAIITDKINFRNLSTLAKRIMQQDQQVEQVGYLRDNNFQMMGGELSINGLLAATYLQSQSNQINGLDFTVMSDTVTLTLPFSIVLNISKDLVKLQGITYQVISDFPQSKLIKSNIKQKLKWLATDSLASGIIYYNNNVIRPLVYVKKTKTFVWENACGSGSLAYSLVTGNPAVIQPSGATLEYKITKDTITVTATVKEI
jgi:hypothetical protein